MVNLVTCVGGLAAMGSNSVWFFLTSVEQTHNIPFSVKHASIFPVGVTAIYTTASTLCIQLSLTTFVKGPLFWMF